MADRPSRRTLLIALGALVVAALLAYWGYGAYQTRELTRAIAATLGDVNARLRDALLDSAGGPSPDRAQKLADHVAATERQRDGLRRLDATRERALADATDSYLVTARELLRRQADRERHRLLLAESLPALHQHMRSDNRTGAWVRQAVAARERVNRDYRGYRTAADTAGQLLESLGAAQQSVAAVLDAGARLPDDLIAGARKAIADDAARLAGEMEQVRRMAAPR